MKSIAEDAANFADHCKYSGRERKAAINGFYAASVKCVSDLLDRPPWEYVNRLEAMKAELEAWMGGGTIVPSKD